MAVCAPHVALGDFTQYGVPRITSFYHLCNCKPLRLGVAVIELKHHRVRFTTVYTRVFSEVVEDLFGFVVPKLLIEEPQACASLLRTFGVSALVLSIHAVAAARRVPIFISTKHRKFYEWFYLSTNATPLMND